MVLNYNVSEEDYLAYNMFFHKTSESMKKQILMFRIWFPIIWLAMVFLIGFDHMGLEHYVFYLVTAIVGAYYIIFARKILTKAMIKNVKKMLKRGEGSEFLGNCELKLLDDGICNEMDGKRSERRYDCVQKIGQDNERLYVFVGGLTAYIVPFSAFESEEQKQEFIKTIKEKANVE